MGIFFRTVAQWDIPLLQHSTAPNLFSKYQQISVLFQKSRGTVLPQAARAEYQIGRGRKKTQIKIKINEQEQDAAEG